MQTKHNIYLQMRYCEFKSVYLFVNLAFMPERNVIWIPQQTPFYPNNTITLLVI